MSQSAEIAQPPRSPGTESDPTERIGLPNDSFWVVPGLLLAGPYPGSLEKAEAEQTINDMLRIGITTFIDLTEEGERGRRGERLRPYSSLLAKIAADRNVEASYMRMAVRDVSVPQRWEMEAIIAAIEISIAKRHPVYVHCLGGVGRTGTVLGCYGIHRGMDSASVLDELAYLRRHTERARIQSPETVEQRDFVTNWPRSKAPASISGLIHGEPIDDMDGYLGSAYPPYVRTRPQRHRWELCVDNALKMSGQRSVDGVIRSWADHLYWTRIDTD